MAEKFTRWDAVDYLKTEEDMALYLDACLDEDSGDGGLIRAAINDVARARGMSQLARDTGISREGLYKALSSTGNRGVLDHAEGDQGAGDQAACNAGIRR